MENTHVCKDTSREIGIVEVIQNVLSKLIGKDATADIKLPVLKLIDESGNILKNSDDDVIDVENIDGSDDPN